MRNQILPLMALACTQFGFVHARDFDAERLERRAYESALWGQALVAGNEMIEGGMAAGQKLNQVAFFSRPPNWKFQQPTPNNSTLYVQLIYDVKQGPVVVELPPTKGPYSIFGTFLDVWQRPVVDVGAGGDDKGKGGKYFLYNARDPKIKVPEGFLPVPLQTYRGYGTLRVITPDLKTETLDGAVAYIRGGFQQYPYGSDERHPHMDIYDKEYSSLFPWDHTFFQRLQKAINARWPWMVAFVFGLLHGFGFAGALTSIGLPHQAIPLALLFFNVGVELGQLLFITVVLGLVAGFSRLPLRLPEWARAIPPYAIGSLAMFWVIQRSWDYTFGLLPHFLN
jgi:hypothetical protein